MAIKTLNYKVVDVHSKIIKITASAENLILPSGITELDIDILVNDVSILDSEEELILTEENPYQTLIKNYIVYPKDIVKVTISDDSMPYNNLEVKILLSQVVKS